MKGKMNNKYGDISVDKAVLAKYAGAATSEVIGIVGMASLNMKEGVTRLLKRENSGSGVKITINENSMKVGLHVIVAYGVSISAVAQNVMEHVKYKLENYAGMKVEEVNVYIEGVRVVDED